MDFKKFKEHRKKEAQRLKEYLKGRIIKGTESFYAPESSKYRDTKKNQRSPSFVRKHRRHRKIKNKMAYKSRRINRLKSV